MTVDMEQMQKSSGVKSFSSRLLHKFMRGQELYFSCVLPKDAGLISFWLRRLFYKGIRFDTSQLAIIKNLPDDGHIVYTIKYKSDFDYYFYHTRFRHERLPVPEVGFGMRTFFWQPLLRLLRIWLSQVLYLIKHLRFADPYDTGYLERMLEEQRAAFLPLVEKGDFYRRFVKAQVDPIRFLVEFQAAHDRPVYLVPLLIFFGKKPHKTVPSPIDILFGPPSKPGKLRRLVTLFRNPDRVFAEVSQPTNLKSFLNRHELEGKDVNYRALFLRRQLLRQFNRHRSTITGPQLKTVEEFKESILTNERMFGFMQQYASSKNIPMHKVRKKADGYVEEIAAKYSNALISFGAVIVGWIIRTMFDGVIVDEEGLKNLKRMYQESPLIIIPCHKSHIDYLILAYIFFTNDMPCPHVAAGKNLSFWPLGPLFRRGGAFFIRRTFKGAVLYAKVFAEYIHKLLEEGFNIEFFIEGGRSRTGKLILPKLGLLSILINAYKNKATNNLILSPIYIGYDRILEERSYLNELNGQKKESENLKQVIRASRFLKKRYGKIYINFHTPMSLNDILVKDNISLDSASQKEVNVLCRNLGYRVINAINEVSVVTPQALAAAALLNTPKRKFSFAQLKANLDTYLNHLYILNANLADTLLVNPETAVETAINGYVDRKFVEIFQPKDNGTNQSSLLNVVESRRPYLEYYKNNCIAFFTPAALTALTILEKDAFQFSASDLHQGYQFLQEFFKNEFAYDVDKTPEAYVRKVLKAFIDDAILIPHPSLPDTYNLTSSGYRKLRLFAFFLKTYFESYWVVIRFFMRYQGKSISPKDRLKKILSRGNRMYKRHQIDLKESVSKINYQNAIDYFIYHGIRSAAHKDKAEAYATKIQRYLDVLAP